MIFSSFEKTSDRSESDDATFGGEKKFGHFIVSADAGQGQIRRQPPAKTVEVVEEAPAATERGEKIKAELDDLLDEIDEVLEENAEEFVRSYVQKGGE